MSVWASPKTWIGEEVNEVSKIVLNSSSKAYRVQRITASWYYVQAPKPEYLLSVYWLSKVKAPKPYPDKPNLCNNAMKHNNAKIRKNSASFHFKNKILTTKLLEDRDVSNKFWISIIIKAILMGKIEHLHPCKLHIWCLIYIWCSYDPTSLTILAFQEKRRVWLWLYISENHLVRSYLGMNYIVHFFIHFCWTSYLLHTFLIYRDFIIFLYHYYLEPLF